MRVVCGQHVQGAVDAAQERQGGVIRQGGCTLLDAGEVEHSHEGRNAMPLEGGPAAER